MSVANVTNYWNFDSDNANDSIGSNNGTSTNITYSAANGKIGHGAGFNGTSKIVFASTVSGTSAFTINMWVKTSTKGKSLFSKRATPTGSGIVFCQTDGTSGNPYFYDYDGSAFNFNGLTKATNVCDGNYHMITVVINSGHTSGTLYVDASPGTAQTPSGLSWNTDVLNLGYGGDGDSSNFYNGAQDEVGIWLEELSQSDITYLYNSGAGRQPPYNNSVNSGFFMFM